MLLLPKKMMATAEKEKGTSQNQNVIASFLIFIVFNHLVSTSSLADCPALPPPSGNTVVVDTVGEIWTAVNTAISEDTILVADGTHNLGAAGRYMWVDVENVTIRSQSGNRDAVIIDDNYQGTEIITSQFKAAKENSSVAILKISPSLNPNQHLWRCQSGFLYSLCSLIY